MKKLFEGLKALVVDDYENMRKKLSKDLEKLGLKVTEASNGLEALSILSQEKFDVMITDIVMPEMDGFELCEEVRTRADLRNLPVVITSTHCDSNYVIKALRLGADDYISKPIEPDVLEKVLRRIVPTETVEKG